MDSKAHRVPRRIGSKMDQLIHPATETGLALCVGRRSALRSVAIG